MFQDNSDNFSSEMTMFQQRMKQLQISANQLFFN